MNENIFYLPINSNLLSSYIGKGLILPRKYISEKIFDIQTIHADDLLFIKQKWLSGDFTNDCCLEVVLTQAEIDSLIVLENFVLLNNALPISRIKKIYFKNEDQKRKTLYNIHSGDGFVPNIVEVENAESFLEIVQITTSKEGNVKDLSENIKIFNQILGGIAAMKLAGKILKGYNSNYSDNYFATLGSINLIIKNDTEIAEFSTKSSVANIFISSKEKQWNTDFLDILKSDPKGENDFCTMVEKYANKNKNNDLLSAIKGSLGIKWDLLKETDSYSIAIALLLRYGSGKRKGTSDLFSDLISSKIPFSKKTETLLFLYGFHYGYSHFRNKEQINNCDENIKYLMNSQLDYFTIESVYQFSFNNKIDSDEFEYLISWCPKFQSSEKDKIYILDVPVYGLPKIQLSIFQKIKKDLFSFCLEKLKSNHTSLSTSEKIEISLKLDSTLSEISFLESEIQNLKNKELCYNDELNLLKKQYQKLQTEKNNFETLKNKLSKENEALKNNLIKIENELKNIKVESVKQNVISENSFKYNTQLPEHSEINQSLLSNETRVEKMEVSKEKGKEKDKKVTKKSNSKPRKNKKNDDSDSLLLPLI